ncbi:unnamed protein product [Paramecium sonneborni]|uniref:Uncharacterized protein n=1 Tax=Paramecium sonneborni TaxID=65129 RepID=A0A8S1PRL0_9CILI|nr:unnamed protein product [Paramecium sonneborni]CAD8105927.1 unnamed protein product [Paramecium sonneborni]
MHQKQNAIQHSKSQQQQQIKSNINKKNIDQKNEKSSLLQIKTLQQEKPSNYKIYYLKYFTKPVMYNIAIFLNFKEISVMRRVNVQFNQTFISCLPIFKQFYNQQHNIQTDLLKSNMFYNHVPQLLEVDYEEFRSGFQNEFLYTCPDIINKFYLQCIELMVKVLLSDLPKWKFAKYTYEMKAKLIDEKLKMKEKIINFYDLTDKQVEIIKNEAHTFNFQFNRIKCLFCPLSNFVQNLFIITESANYKELKKLKQIEHRINQIQNFLNTYFRNQ